MVEDNQSTPVVDNTATPVVDGATNAGIVNEPVTQTGTVAEPTATATATVTETFTDKAPKSWKSGLSEDMKNSPLMQKFDDTPEGFTKAVESHANLEKLLGHEKVPIPQGTEDIEGWNRFSKAMGIPDAAAGYGLADSKLPESMQGITIDKNKFAEIVHAHKLTPDQANGLWNAYNEINVDAYTKAQQNQQQNITDTVNRLKGEWGDAYQTNVELGQTVINKFTADPEDNDYIASVLSGDPRGIKFLAKIGDQFAESKVGEFQMKKFSLGPEQAQEEITKIKNDPNHPYSNPSATDKEHTAAVDYVNSLYASAGRARG